MGQNPQSVQPCNLKSYSQTQSRCGLELLFEMFYPSVLHSGPLSTIWATIGMYCMASVVYHVLKQIRRFTIACSK